MRWSQIDWIVAYIPFQLIYGYVEMDDDNDDEIDRNLSSISR